MSIRFEKKINELILVYHPERMDMYLTKKTNYGLFPDASQYENLAPGAIILMKRNYIFALEKYMNITLK